MYPISFGSSKTKMAPNLILKTRGADPIITRQRRAWGTHFALNKGQEAPQFTSCRSTRGDLLCSQGSDYTLFCLKEGRCPGESGGQLPLPANAGKATFTQSTLPQKKKKKRQD